VFVCIKLFGHRECLGIGDITLWARADLEESVGLLKLHHDKDWQDLGWRDQISFSNSLIDTIYR
jgi:hypothetical protein